MEIAASVQQSPQRGHVSYGYSDVSSILSMVEQKGLDACDDELRRRSQPTSGSVDIFSLSATRPYWRREGLGHARGSGNDGRRL